MVLPLEESIAAVSGIEEMRAMVSEGSANVIVTFVLERDIGEAAEDVREKVQQAIRKLPPNVLPPTVQKADPDSDPVITLSVNGNRSSPRTDGDSGQDHPPRDRNGGRSRRRRHQRRAEPPDQRLPRSRQAERVQHERAGSAERVQTENVETPGGRIVRGPTEVGVRTLGRVEHVEEFNNIIVKNVNGAPIRIRDVGHVEDGMSEKRTFAYYKGKPAVVLEVRRQMGTNTVKVVEDIQKELASINKTLPAGVKIDVVKEQASYIKASVAALEEHLILGFAPGVFIVWLFIRDWRMVLISSVAIPTSIITTFTAHADDGFQPELDDAARVDAGGGYCHRRRDHRPREHLPVHAGEGAAADAGGGRSDKRDRAGRYGDDAVAGHHLRPDRIHTGYAKRYMNQFGWTMAVSIMVSMLVAFTLTPTLSADLIGWRRKREDFTAHEHKVGPMERGYSRMLDWSMAHRLVIVGICVLTLGSTFIINKYIGRDWMPQEDQSELGLPGDAGRSSLAATEKLALDMAKKAGADSRGHGGDPGVFAAYGERVTMCFITVLLEDRRRARRHSGNGPEGSRRAPRVRVRPAADHIPERARRARNVLAHSRSAAGSGHGTAGRSWLRRRMSG